eukprot:TRINITY_DN10402_c6_g1_i1.p1 TRINITY_DN10402_c6_g1~~TRINITY_DN10402_c6_g1_i1.p1  ORF type:complete len:421 (+),score=118.64 TRINITY_DN10402_c6_g1_i1:130-1263(+)
MEAGGVASPRSAGPGAVLRYLDKEGLRFQDVVYADDSAIDGVIDAAIPDDDGESCGSLPEQSAAQQATADGAAPRKLAATHTGCAAECSATPPPQQQRPARSRGDVQRWREAARRRWRQARAWADAFPAAGGLVSAFSRPLQDPTAQPPAQPQPQPQQQRQAVLAAEPSLDLFEDAGRVLGWLQAICSGRLSADARHGSALRSRLASTERIASAGRGVTGAVLAAAAARIARDWYQGRLSDGAAVRYLGTGALRAAAGGAGAYAGARAAHRAAEAVRIRQPVWRLAAMLCGTLSGGAAASAAWGRLFGGDSRAAALRRAYEVLGVAPSASDAALHSRYLQLAASHHVDRGGDPGLFATINAAYALIKTARETPAARL